MLTKELILQTSTLLMLFSLPLPGDKLHAPKVKSWNGLYFKTQKDVWTQQHAFNLDK